MPKETELNRSKCLVLEQMASHGQELSTAQWQRLVELYRYHSQLWDATRSDFRNKDCKNSAYEDIKTKMTTEFGIVLPVDEIKAKLTSLRYGYSKELYRLQHKQGEVETDVSETYAYGFFKQLDFLRNTIIPRKSPNLDQTGSLDSSSAQDKSQICSLDSSSAQDMSQICSLDSSSAQDKSQMCSLDSSSAQDMRQICSLDSSSAQDKSQICSLDSPSAQGTSQVNISDEKNLSDKDWNLEDKNVDLPDNKSRAENLLDSGQQGQGTTVADVANVRAKLEERKKPVSEIGMRAKVKANWIQAQKKERAQTDTVLKDIAIYLEHKKPKMDRDKMHLPKFLNDPVLLWARNLAQELSEVSNEKTREILRLKIIKLVVDTKIAEMQNEID